MNLTGRLLLFALVTCRIALAPAETSAQDHIPWRSDVEQAKKLAAEEDKLVLLHFSASWCTPCKELDRFVFVNPLAIRSLSTQVIPVRIDVDLNRDLASEYNVTSVPYDVLVTPAGHVVSERVSPRSSDGYLQMIQMAKSAAASLSNEAVQEVGALRQEYQRLNEVRQASQEQKETYGTLARAESSQFVPNYQAQPGVKIPGFEGPATWSASENDVQPAMTAQEIAAGAGVERTSRFQPAGPATPDQPSATGPVSPRTPATAMGGRFVPAAGKRAGETTAPQPVNSGLVAAEDRASPNDRASSTPARIQNRFAVNTRDTEPAEPVRILNPLARRQTADSGVAPAATNTPATPAASSTKALPPLGLRGFCGVSLVEDQSWTRGDRKWGCIHRGRLYLFASESKREQFRKSPDLYSPLLGGADPVAFHTTGELVEGMRKHGVFYGDDGGPTVVVLFRNLENRAAFEADPADYLKTVRQAMSQLDGGLLKR